MVIDLNDGKNKNFTYEKFKHFIEIQKMITPNIDITFPFGKEKITFNYNSNFNDCIVVSYNMVKGELTSNMLMTDDLDRAIKDLDLFISFKKGKK